MNLDVRDGVQRLVSSSVKVIYAQLPGHTELQLSTSNVANQLQEIADIMNPVEDADVLATKLEPYNKA